MSIKLHLDIATDSERLIALHEPIYSLQLSSISMLDSDRNTVLSDAGAVKIQLSSDGGATFKITKTISASPFSQLRIDCFNVTHIKLSASAFTSAKFISIKTTCLSSDEFSGKHNSQDITELLALFSEKPIETTLAELGSAQSAGAEVVVTDYKKPARSDGRGFKHDLRLYVEYPSRISQAMRDVLYGNVAKKAISFIGHSIVYGQNTGASEADYKTTSLPARIAARLNAYLGTALDTGAIFCGTQQQSLWTLAGGAVYRQDLGGNGYQSIRLGAGNTAAISVKGTSIKLYLMAAAVGITVSYTIDGGGSVVAPASANNPMGDGTWYYYPITIDGLSAGDHTVVITGPATSAVNVVGAEGRSSSAGVVVHRAGNPGMVLADMLAVSMDLTDTTGNATWRTAAQNAKVRQLGSLTTLLSPSLVMLMFDVNDLIRGWQTYGYTLADCKRHLTNTLAALSAQGLSVLVVIGPWLATTSYAAGCPFAQDDLAMVYREAVSESANASLIDIRTPLYSRQGFSNPMMDAYAHLTAVGANALGQKIADAMIDSASWF